MNMLLEMGENPLFLLSVNEYPSREFSSPINIAITKEHVEIVKLMINKSNLDEEQFLNDLLELNIENFEELDDEYQLLIEPEDFGTITTELENKNYNLEGDLSLVPTNTITVNSQHLDQISKLIEILEDHDDVQKVHTNLEVAD